MFDRKYRLHIEASDTLFQYEGPTLPTPEQMREYLAYFNAGLASKAETINLGGRVLGIAKGGKE